VCSSVNIYVDTQDWYDKDYYVTVNGGGVYRGNRSGVGHITVVNIGSEGAATVGSSVTDPKKVYPLFKPDSASTTATYTQPAVGSSVNIYIADTTWLSAGMVIQVGDATVGGGVYTVTTVASTYVAATCLARYSEIISAPKLVRSRGIQGPEGKGLYLPGGSCAGAGYSTLSQYASGAQYDYAMGYYAGSNITTGDYNIAIGYNALWYDATKSLTGNDNIAIGRSALARITGAVHNNVAIGKEAASWCTGSANVAIGNSTGAAITTGASNVILGDTATSSGNLSGSYNVIAGYGAVSNSSLTSAAYNVALGWCALSQVTTGQYNTAINANAGDTITTGQYNVCIGVNSDAAAGAYSAVAIGDQSGSSSYSGIAASYSIQIGYQTYASQQRAVAIGYQAYATGATGSIQLGQGTNARAGYTLQVGGASSGDAPAYYCYAQAWTAYSDRRLKKDIVPLPNAEGLAMIEALEPVRYRLKSAGNNGRVRWGLIAQDVKATLDRIGLPGRDVYTDDDENGWAIDYDQLVAPLVKAVQELSDKITRLEAELNDLRKR